MISGWLRGHWEAKLVALVLACALWWYTSGQVRVERTVAVRVDLGQITGLDGRFQAVGVEPAEFTAVLSVPSARLEGFRADTLAPHLEVPAGRAIEGAVTFPITSRTLGLDGDVRLVRTEPEHLRTITVTLGTVAEDLLPVEVPAVASLPPGIEPVLRLDRTRVRVRAANQVLDRERAARRPVRFAPINLGDIDPRQAREREERVVLAPLPAPYAVLEPVTAVVLLRPVVEAKQVLSLPVHLLLPRELLGRAQIEVGQAQVAVTVRGPQNLLRAMAPDDLTAFVNLRRLPEAGVPQEVPVSVLGPPWAVCDPVSVRVSVAGAAAAPAGPRPPSPALLPPE